MNNREKRGREEGRDLWWRQLNEQSQGRYIARCVCMAPSGTKNFNVSKPYWEKNHKFGWGHSVGLEGGPTPKPCPLTSQVCKRDVQIVYVRNRRTIRKSTLAWTARSLPGLHQEEPALRGLSQCSRNIPVSFFPFLLWSPACWREFEKCPQKGKKITCNLTTVS